MKWSKLKNYECPKCGFGLRKYFDSAYVCTASECGFRISKKRYDEIVDSLYKHPGKEFHTADNQAELNNLGHDVVEEDFSDSRALDY
jgi:hypothetical protein